MLDFIKTLSLFLVSFVVGISSATASSCKNVFFTHYMNKDYVISVDDREFMRTFLSADYNIGGRGQKWSLFNAYSSIIPDSSKAMFYVSLADNERKIWGIEFFGSFWFQAELVPLDYSPWSIVEAVPVEGLPDVITLRSPVAEEKVQTSVCLSPITEYFHRAPGTDILRFQSCSVHPKEWNYWVPKDTETGENCTEAVLSKSNYHSPVTVDPQSLCSSVFLKPVLSEEFFISAENNSSNRGGVFLDNKNVFSFKQVWIPRVDFLPSSKYLFINLVWGEDKDYAITVVKGTKLVPAHLVISKFDGSDSQAWFISSSRSSPGAFAILDASNMYQALTVNRDFKVGSVVELDAFSDDPSQLWRAISTQTGTDCSSVFVNSFSGASVGNIISAKTNRAAVPVVHHKDKKVDIDWQPGSGGSDVYYTILHSDLVSSPSGFTKKLHYAIDPTECFVPIFSSTTTPHLSLVDCMKNSSSASVWRFGSLGSSEDHTSQFCIDDQAMGKVWCLADLAGSFANPVDESGLKNPDTMMYFSERVIGIPTVFASGNGLCLGVDENSSSKLLISMSCRENRKGVSIGNLSIVPSSTNTEDPRKKYLITFKGSDKSVMCYADRGDVLSFVKCDKNDPSLQWIFLPHGRIKNIKSELCLSAGNTNNVPVYAVSCDSSRAPRVVFFTLPHSGISAPNVYMQLHHWDLVNWTDYGLCVTVTGEMQPNSQEPCADPLTDKGKHQLWWREFSRTGFAQGDLISAVDDKLVLSMTAGYVLSHQTVSTWGGWSVQKFLMYDTYQTAATDSIGIVYCYSDGDPGHPSSSSIVADACKEDWGVGINNQTWLFTPVVLST
ncbi:MULTISPECIES: hypothetical protein [Candidatus Ichthyocystis]|uniref:Putative toxin domain protein n=1 Tax=Candidatus Ichthyocystis hellenicum TaxID=1561003 RepID=A0A0S4LZJ8_9BURK|nr:MULTISPECIES: hypothetical protein [Ichthyocystis]CUT16983.1 putative toxin domain protein [Candidatus Ichthyocystis hellenicum]